MSGKNSSGTILIQENTLLPADLAIASEAFLLGWRIVRGIDAHGLGRKIEEAHWNFFCLAGQIKTIAFGCEGQESERRAVERLLVKLKGENFNCLEITEVIAKHFLGIPFLSVGANSRHIQESFCLTRGKTSTTRIPVATRRTEMDSAGQPRSPKVYAKQDRVLVSSS